MAFVHGKAATLSINAQAITPYCDSVDFGVDVETADTTTFGAAWKTALAGIPGGKLDVSGVYDSAAAPGPAAVFWACIAGGVPVAGVFKPAGTTSGTWTWTAGLLVTSYSESSPVGDKVTFKASMIQVALPVRSA